MVVAKLKYCSIKRMLFVLFTTLSLASCSIHAQSLRHYKVKAQRDEVYIGYNVHFGVPHYTIHSPIGKLDGKSAGFFGATAGGVLANPITKVKAGIGYYYSDDSFPYIVDMVSYSCSANLYLLRLRQLNCHAIEPYISTGINHFRNKFHGAFLDDQKPLLTDPNDELLLGIVSVSQVVVGGGIEFRLDSGDSFVHFYLEGSYGTSVQTTSTDLLRGTLIPNSFWISAGMSFGKIR